MENIVLNEIISSIKESDNLIKVINKALKKDSFIKKLSNSKMSYHLTMSSLDVLENTNRIIETYLNAANRLDPSEGPTLLLIFGVLQSLFIGIDSLYLLSRGITRRKWSVNINQNKTLKQIKYIRNDVVGHPSYRKYSKNDVGFCIIDTKKITNTEFYYTSYTVVNNKERVKEHHINILNLIKNYYIESNKIMEVILKRIGYEREAIDLKVSISLTDDVYKLFQDYKIGKENRKLLERIRETYIRKNNINVNTNDRFLWRISMIEELFAWDEEENYRQEMIKFITKGQMKKLHSMAISFDKDFNTVFTKSTLPSLRYPSYLKFFYKFACKNKSKLDSSLEILHDSSHPYYDAALDRVLRFGFDNEIVFELCNWLKEVKEYDKEGNKVFLLGGELKRYYKTKSKLL